MMQKPQGRCPSGSAVPLLATMLAFSPPPGGTAVAYDINDQLKSNALVAGAFQCQESSGVDGADNACRGAAPSQPELLYNPTEQNQVFVKLRFAAGNGLNPVSPFVRVPWAADLHDDVTHINGRDRSHLLEDWCAHTFNLGADHRVQLTE
jgi:hypothetical protein